VRVARNLVVFVVIVVLGGAALAGCVALLVPAGASFRDSTSYGPLLPAMNEQPQRSYVFDSKGGVMTTLFAEDRQPVQLSEIPQQLIDAVLAIEDRRFYEHDGVDYEGTTRALFQNIDAGQIEQGGSTITQQLVKNTMGDPKKRDLKTKVREAILAVRLENEMSKNEILERYLNIIYLGNGAYGVKAAAERYFDKRDPKELTLGQCALLAGLIQSPETLNPITHPDRAARRRAQVLDAMIDTGKITEEQARQAREEPLPTKAVSPDRKRDAFTQLIVDQLTTDHAAPGSPATYLGTDATSRYNSLFKGGLKIYTSYDPATQFLALSSVQQVLPPNRDPRFTAAVAVIDNATGEVRAIYSGTDFTADEYNTVVQKGRQTGSSFKAITLATALDAGYSPNDRVSGSSFDIKLPQQPSKRLSCSGGTLTLAEATAKSNNCAYTRILESLGPGHFGSDGAQRVIDMAGRLGIDTSKLSPVPSLTLGTSDTNLLDMAEAFSVFANDGIHRDPIFITKIEGPDGKVIYQADTAGQRVLPEQIARTETQVLTGVIEDGTGTRARIDRPAAGKTGTTTDYTDALFIGYTPQYTTAVWMGNPKHTNEAADQMRNVGGIAVTGGSYPARIWSAVMSGIHKNLPVIQFTPPDEKQWPPAQGIDEFGRSAKTLVQRRPATPGPGPTVPGAAPTVPPPAAPVGPDPNAPVEPVPPDTAPPG
jgi:penicillin-binding protein 1A